MLVTAAATLAGCAPAAAPAPAATAASTPLTSFAPTTPPPTSRPPLPLGADGTPRVLPTPPELVDRRLPTIDELPPPANGQFTSTVALVPPDVLARSTWAPDCPVAATDLRYVTVVFHGFDGRPHTGELLLHASVAAKVAAAFRDLWEADFPIERMRVTSIAERDAPATGDGNTTAAFVCRPARGLARWSAHAYGLAVDVDPFQNPYRSGDRVLPELASAYLDRDHVRPGMIRPGDAVVAAFAHIGFTWGGTWRSPVDLQHFSATGD
jgi:hypothetical protein